MQLAAVICTSQKFALFPESLQNFLFICEVLIHARHTIISAPIFPSNHLFSSLLPAHQQRMMISAVR